jgi:hypothetical protein
LNKKKEIIRKATHYKYHLKINIFLFLKIYFIYTTNKKKDYRWIGKISSKIKHITKKSLSFKIVSLNKIKERRGINVNIIKFF